MKLWLISRNGVIDYDEYDSAVVVAATEEQARNTHPSGSGVVSHEPFDGWVASAAAVNCVYLGEAEANVKPGVVCASYNAG